MIESQTPGPAGPGASRVAVVLGVTLAALALAAALFVVVKSLRKVRPETLPPSLRTAPPDTGFVVLRASIRRRTLSLSARCESKRRQFANGMTPAQNSLSRECDSAIAVVLSRIAAFDTISRANRKPGADSLQTAYDRARLAVRVFTRSGLQRDLVDQDSLDLEIKRLISE